MAGNRAAGRAKTIRRDMLAMPGVLASGWPHMTAWRSWFERRTGARSMALADGAVPMGLAASIALVMVTLSLSGCAAALMGRAASSGTTSGSSAPTSSGGGASQRSTGSSSAGTAAGARSAAQVEQDRQVAAAVRGRLLADVSTKSLAVSVDAYQSVVSLHGEVARAEQRSAAERVARSVAGVRSVRNELRVR